MFDGSRTVNSLTPPDSTEDAAASQKKSGGLPRYGRPLSWRTAQESSSTMCRVIVPARGSSGAQRSRSPRLVVKSSRDSGRISSRQLRSLRKMRIAKDTLDSLSDPPRLRPSGGDYRPVPGVWGRDTRARRPGVPVCRPGIAGHGVGRRSHPAPEARHGCPARRLGHRPERRFDRRAVRSKAGAR